MNRRPSDMTHCLVSSEVPASCASETLMSMRPTGELQTQSESTGQLCLTLPQLSVTACPVSSSLSLLSPLCQGLPAAGPTQLCKGQEASQHAPVPNHSEVSLARSAEWSIFEKVLSQEQFLHVQIVEKKKKKRICDRDHMASKA